MFTWRVVISRYLNQLTHDYILVAWQGHRGDRRKKTLSRIPLKAPKPKGPARLLLYINVMDFCHFHMLEIRGSP